MREPRLSSRLVNQVEFGGRLSVFDLRVSAPEIVLNLGQQMGFLPVHQVDESQRPRRIGRQRGGPQQASRAAAPENRQLKLMSKSSGRRKLRQHSCLRPCVSRLVEIDANPITRQIQNVEVVS